MKFKLIFATTVLGVGILAFIAGRFIAPSTPGSGDSTDHSSHNNEPTIWTCSMHPQIQQADPGNCPICGMDLIPLADEEDNLGPRAMKMSESAMALAEIRTSLVKQDYPTVEIKLVGTLVYDETRVRSLTDVSPSDSST